MTSLNLHKVLYLYKTFSKFYIQPVEEPNEALIIDRQTCEITANSMFSVNLLPANATSCLIYGVIGIKHLISCPYLIVITKATQIGLIKGQAIYRMDQAQVIPCNPNVAQSHNSSGSNGKLVADWNTTYVSMLESVLQMPNFYFSYSYDLTNSLQRTHTYQNDPTMSLETDAHHLFDKRFLWNDQLMNEFDRCGKVANKYRLPFILGFVSINKVYSSDLELRWILISRRSVKRAGTRFNRRGIDHDGNVANFVETEQIIEHHMNSIITLTGSFVQVRGSIPLFWRQKCHYHTYKPAIEVETSNEHKALMGKHFNELNHYYGNVSVVNLIDKRGHEAMLEHEFSQKMAELHQETNSQWPKYHYFDFHKECSKMRWHRLNILLDSLQQEIESFGYFLVSGNQVIRQQNGVIRSNCIDSLDRTNVVQSMIAQRVLEMQFKNFKNFMGWRLNGDSPFLAVFMNAWADNADKLSIQYAGTPALKTDFTRTGQRTSNGMVKDGVNSLTRYVTNNFFDDYRQDAIDLFLGNFEGYPSPKYRHMDLTSTLPFTIIVLTFVLLYIYLRY